MKNKITITGKISTILEKEYQGAKTTQVQFLMESDSKGIEVIKVKITKDEDKLKLFKDAIVAKIGLNRTTMQELDRTQKRSLTGQ